MAVPTPPGFTLHLVRNRTVGGLVGANTLGMVLHVQAGNGALSGWFDNPTAQASSTWWAGKAGGRQQYGNPDTDKMWAQAAGNSTYHSIETEGQPSEPLTPEQIESAAVAYAFGHARYGWPFRLAEKPGDLGLGWHGMGGKAWGGHTGCPGDLRKAQRPAILARAQQIAQPPKEWDEMATKAEIQQAVIDALNTDGLVASPMFASNPTVAPVTALRYTMEWSLAARNAAQLAADPKALAAAVVPLLPQGTAVSETDLETALRNVLGSLDNPKES